MRAIPVLPALVLSTALVVAACGSSQATDSAQSDGAQSDSGGSEASVDVDSVAIVPGDVGEGQVTIDETVIDYTLVTPEGFVPGDAAPVLLAMPPGGQDADLTRQVTSGTYATEAIARGWVVISPAAPDGVLYFNGSETLIPGLLDWINAWVTPEDGRLHLAGISNGGLSSFRLAALQPEAFHSVLVFPGFPRSDEDKAALDQLADIPVRMFVGENDAGWISPMEETLETLTGLGGDATLEVRLGEGHVMQSLSDGVDIFDTLDALR